MKRVLVLAVVALAALAGLPAGAAAAATTPFAASIVCDAATGTVTASAGGSGFAANYPVRARFTVSDGWYLTTTGAISTVPQRGQTVTVPATVDAAGVLAPVTGYTRAWNPAQYAFYRETVQVEIVHRDTGAFVATRTARCHRDVRTTLTVTCDPLARTVSATLSGVDATLGVDRYGANAPSTATIQRSVTWFRTGEPVGWSTTYTETKRITRDPGGATWTLPLFAQDVTAYSSYKVDLVIDVLGAQYGAPVGRATGGCTYRPAAA
jgi:hypothetical protein